MRFFNTAGPVKFEIHYCLSMRLDISQIKNLIDQKSYFALYAPRQSGKTTAMSALVDQLNREGKYKALYVNVESAQAARGRYLEGIMLIVSCLKAAIQLTFGPDDPALKFFEGKKLVASEATGDELQNFLAYWAEHSEKPIFLCIDEIDALIGDTLIAVLRQLRAGYAERPKHFPQSLCLVGVRDVRDYRIWSDENQQSIIGGSAFNIKTESLVLPSFSLQEVRELYQQHTEETGQQITEDAINYVFEQTQGQPWLVNAIAYEACFRDVTDRTKVIDAAVMERARNQLIIRCDTHIDALIARLHEPRVCRVIDAMISGRGGTQDIPDDDLQYTIDLGLLVQRDNAFQIANPIYKEILPRAIVSRTLSNTITQQLSSYQNPDGSLNMDALLEAFRQFFRENSAIWLDKFDYKESGPHLLMMAFLQRVINGGGKINREYALGTGRVDLLVIFREQRIVIELKIGHHPKYVQDGLQQTAKYMDTSNATTGHLVIFDPSNTSWDEKMYRRVEEVQGKKITIWGC